jgi:MYXO-CTERM domain-containing protein
MLTLNSGFTQSSTGDLQIKIGGLNAGTDFDQVVASGAVSLAGTLDIEVINGFAPTLGDTYVFLKYGSLTGDFSSITATGLGSGLAFVEYNDAVNHDLYLQVETAQDTATPEPGTWLTGAAGLLLLGLRRFRATLK